MTQEALRIISEAMESMGIPYAFLRYRETPLPHVYFVGEYTETQGFTEDGLQEATVLLTGYCRGTMLDLFTARDKIKAYFPPYGRTEITESGAGIAVLYGNMLVLPTGDAEFQRIQINLQIKEWSVA